MLSLLDVVLQVLLKNIFETADRQKMWNVNIHWNWANFTLLFMIQVFYLENQAWNKKNRPLTITNSAIYNLNQNIFFLNQLITEYLEVKLIDSISNAFSCIIFHSYVKLNSLWTIWNSRDIREINMTGNPSIYWTYLSKC